MYCTDAQAYSHLRVCHAAVTFLESWKRTEASLAHRWDVADYEDEEVRTCVSLNERRSDSRQQQQEVNARRSASGPSTRRWRARRR